MKITTFFGCVLTGALTFTLGVTAATVTFHFQPFTGTPDSSGTPNAQEDPRWQSLGNGTSITLDDVSDRPGRYYLKSNFDGEFANFTYIEIQSPASYNVESEWGAQSLNAKAFVKENTIGFDSLFIEHDRIIFETQEVGGERYVFMGSFRSLTKCGIDVATSGIDGYLAKFKEGRLISSMNAAFYLVYGC